MPRKNQCRSRLSRVLTVAYASLIAVALTACAGLTPFEESLIMAGDAAACGLMSGIQLVGGFLAGACEGEEAALKAALDAHLLPPAPATPARVDGGPAPMPVPLAFAGPVSLPVTHADEGPLCAATHRAVYRGRARRRHLSGCVPAALFAEVQKNLDAASDVRAMP
jgi:hypothetical protein